MPVLGRLCGSTATVRTPLGGSTTRYTEESLQPPPVAGISFAELNIRELVVGTEGRHDEVRIEGPVSR